MKKILFLFLIFACTVSAQVQEIRLASPVTLTNIFNYLLQHTNVVGSVSNVVEMLSLPSLTNNDVVITAGRTTAGDGGGGIFICSLDDGSVTNTGTIFRYLLSTNMLLKRFDTTPVNIRWFGATGDGITDDTDEIQTTIDFVQSGSFPSAISGNAVYFPSGTYKVSDQLNITTSGLKIYGDSCESSMIKNFNTTNAVFYYIGAAGRIEFNDFSISQDASVVAVANQCGIRCEAPAGNSVAVFAENVHIYGTYRGWWLTHNTESSFINCKVNSCVSEAFYGDDWNTLLSFINCWGNTVGIGFSFSGSGDISFINCAVDVPSDKGFYLTNCSLVTLQSCPIEAFGTIGIHLDSCSQIDINAKLIGLASAVDGIRVDGGSSILLNSCIVDGSVPGTGYSLNITNAVTGLTIVNGIYTAWGAGIINNATNALQIGNNYLNNIATTYGVATFNRYMGWGLCINTDDLVVTNGFAGINCSNPNVDLHVGAGVISGDLFGSATYGNGEPQVFNTAISGEVGFGLYTQNAFNRRAKFFFDDVNNICGIRYTVGSGGWPSFTVMRGTTEDFRIDAAGNISFSGTLNGATNLMSVVDTIADMVSLNTITKQTNIVVLGYSSVNDGGGGMFYIKTDDGSTTNFGTVFRSITNTNKLFCRIYDPGTVNVRWFGAGLGGDDYARITNAIGCLSTGGRLYFDAGNYLISKRIVIDTVGFQGLDICGPSPTTATITCTADTGAFLINDSHFVKIRNLKIVGPNSGTVHGIELTSAWYCEIDTCWIYTFGGSGIYFSGAMGASHTCYIRDCFVTDNLGDQISSADCAVNALHISGGECRTAITNTISGISVSGTDITVRDVTIESVGNGITIPGGSGSFNYLIDGCYFEGILTNCIQLCTAGNAQGVQLVGNYMNLDSAICGIYGESGSRTIRGLFINGNTFSGIPSGTYNIDLSQIFQLSECFITSANGETPSTHYNMPTASAIVKYMIFGRDGIFIDKLTGEADIEAANATFSSFVKSAGITNTAMTAGRILLSDTGGLMTNSSAFTWVGTNIGVGTTTPTQHRLVVAGGTKGFAVGTTDYIYGGAGSCLLTRPVVDTGDCWMELVSLITGATAYNGLSVARLGGNFGLGIASVGANADKVFSHGNGTLPTTVVADGYQLYSADLGGVNGKAAPHIYTEDGAKHVFGSYVGIGTTNPAATLNVVSSDINASLFLDTYDNGANSSDFSFRKSKTDTKDTLVETVDGDILGIINFIGVDSGVNRDSGAQIYVKQLGASGTYVPSQIIFRTWGSSALNDNALVIHTNGNLGIGTTEPVANFDIFSDNLSAAAFRITRLSGPANYLSISPPHGTATASKFIVSGQTVVTMYSNQGIGIGDYADVNTAPPSKGLIVSGNLGIGITNPVSKLHVAGNAILQNATTPTAFKIHNTYTDATNLQYLDMSARTNNSMFIGPVSLGTAGTNVQMVIASAGSSNITFQTAGTDRMVIDGSGKVGIGIGSPGGVLHLHEPTAVTPIKLIINNAYTGSASTDGFGLSVDEVGTAFVDQKEAASLIFRTAGTEKMKIASAGNVGIATSYPKAKLHIAGDVAFANTSTNVDRYRLVSAPKALTDGGTDNIVLITCPTNLFTGGTIYYTINALDVSNDGQAERGQVEYALHNKDGAGTPTITEHDSIQSLSAGSLATTWSATLTSGTNLVITLAADTSLTPVVGAAGFGITYTVQQDPNATHSTITPQ